ncbi:sensor histidine kinase [Dehalococcoides mccartyi]|uniref:histidine kinase n=1 Tax=Dehalococcoides mccartyi (strain CBDB1) TaxID=255470 RepID=A0A916KLG7_DEHMC|nr:PAS domain S-box protein [Dehalococcoides mccartyi]CAI82343.1 sensor histidine kinase [Dehalococcoides mccartyi CBDB1]
MEKDLEKYYLAFHGAIDGIVFIDCSSGLIKDCNPAFEKLVGRPLEELKKTNIWQLRPVAERSLAKKMFEEMASGGARELAELNIERPDGTIVPIELRVKRISQNDDTFLVSIARDISEKKLIREALIESEKTYRAIFETAGVAMAIDDENTFIKLANSRFAKLTGFEIEELEGKKSWRQFVAPKNRAEIYGSSHERKANPEKIAPMCYEFELIDRYKNKRAILLDCTSIPGRKMTVASLLDITDFKASEEEARKARNIAETYRISEKVKAELLSVVSHELRTPLTSIKGLTDSLLRKDVNWDDNTKKDFLESIRSETGKLSRLIDDLLDTTKLERNLLKLKRGKGTILQVIEAIKIDMECLTEKHQVIYDLQDGQSPLFIDKMRIGQVILNIVGNSVKYSLPSSKIKISSKSLGGHLVVAISDEGRGISGKDIPYVFDYFYQDSKSEKKRNSGMGLGLAICRGIIKAHGGDIWVENAADIGAIVSFTIPLVKAQKVSGEKK